MFVGLTEAFDESMILLQALRAPDLDTRYAPVNVAKSYEVSRADMDKYAQRSQELAVKSQEDGFFDREIVPVELPDGNEVTKDDGPRPSSTLASSSCGMSSGTASRASVTSTASCGLVWSPCASAWPLPPSGSRSRSLRDAPSGGARPSPPSRI